MRVVIFRIIILLLVLGGGQKFYARQLDGILTFGSSSGITKNAHDRFSHKDHHSVVLEDNDFDIEDEPASSQIKKGGNSKFSSAILAPFRIASFSHLGNTWRNAGAHYLIHASTILGQSNPIYLAQRALRI